MYDGILNNWAPIPYSVHPTTYYGVFKHLTAENGDTGIEPQSFFDATFKVLQFI